MNITLRAITRANWRECVSLEPAPEQALFVAPNAVSLAQATYEPEWLPLAIYDEDTMVGFVMYGRNHKDGDKNWIMRLMVDSQYQRRGHGRAAMQEVIRRLRQEPDCDEIAISYEAENVVAERLYLSLGFRKTGEVIYVETVARLNLER
jgi:diamine N-acetyltransferase